MQKKSRLAGHRCTGFFEVNLSIPFCDQPQKALTLSMVICPLTKWTISTVNEAGCAAYAKYRLAQECYGCHADDGMLIGGGQSTITVILLASISIAFASATAGLSTTKIGTANSMPSREEIDKIL